MIILLVNVGHHMAVASGRAGDAMALPIFHDDNDVHNVLLQKRDKMKPRYSKLRFISERFGLSPSVYAHVKKQP